MRTMRIVIGLILVVFCLGFVLGCPSRTQQGGTPVVAPMPPTGQGVGGTQPSGPPQPPPPTLKAPAQPTKSPAPAGQPQKPQAAAAPSVKITKPTAGATATVAGLLLQIAGTSQLVYGQDRKIILYVNAHKGPSGWYLQIPGYSGVNTVNADGTWNGDAQIGNREYPPKGSDPAIDIAAVVVSTADAEKAAAKAGENPDRPVFQLPDGVTRHVITGVKLDVR
jgi:hypothetical protein